MREQFGPYWSLPLRKRRPLPPISRLEPRLPENMLSVSARLPRLRLRMSRLLPERQSDLRMVYRPQ